MSHRSFTAWEDVVSWVRAYGEVLYAWTDGKPNDNPVKAVARHLSHDRIEVQALGWTETFGPEHINRFFHPVRLEQHLMRMDVGGDCVVNLRFAESSSDTGLWQMLVETHLSTPHGDVETLARLSLDRLEDLAEFINRTIRKRKASQ